MKIIFIPNLPYTYRDHQRFGVEYFLLAGYDVEVMDAHKILVPGYKEKVPIDYWTFDHYYEVSSTQEAINRVKNLSTDDYIFFYGNGNELIHFLTQLQQNSSAKFITYVGGSIPISFNYCNILKKIVLTIKVTLKRLIPKYRTLKFNTDFFVSGSPKDELMFPSLIGKKTKIIRSNSRDYNLCLETKPYPHERSYCVFLDTDVIDASDYILFKDKTEKNIDIYQKKISDFFRWIEKEFNIDVIISAHPKSRIYKDSNDFHGFKVVHGKSAELVCGSAFVLNEGTTAVSFAVFFNKPLIFFTFKEIEFFYEYCCVFSKEFKKSIIDIDYIDKPLFESELKNNSGYLDYKNNFLTYTDEKITTFKLIEKELYGR